MSCLYSTACVYGVTAIDRCYLVDPPFVRRHLASIVKFVSSDTYSEDCRKRRSAFLKELIASTSNVSVRAKEFRRWIDENSNCSDNEKV